MHFLEKVKTALQNFENHKVLWKGPVRPNEGPWLVMDPVRGSSCVPRVPWFLMFRMQKYGPYSRFSPVGHLAHRWKSETPVFWNARMVRVNMFKHAYPIGLTYNAQNLIRPFRMTLWGHSKLLISLEYPFRNFFLPHLGYRNWYPLPVPSKASPLFCSAMMRET